MAQPVRVVPMERALKICLEAGHPDLLRAFLTHPMGEAVPRTWEWVGFKIVVRGNAACLRVLHECGFALSDWAWETAAKGGHVNCLEFAASRGYTLSDSLFHYAMNHGKLACVEFLLQQGLPRGPYKPCICSTDVDQLKCLEVALDKGVAIDTETLISAAEWEQVEAVRLLHGRGVPLWRHARDLLPLPGEPYLTAGSPGTIVIPPDLRPMWEVLRYGAVCGAPVTPRVKELFQEKQQRTHAVLLCFKAAARLCKCPGCARQRQVWASMAALPAELIEEILILAELEIRESIMRRLPLHAPALRRRLQGAYWTQLFACEREGSLNRVL